MKIRSVLLIVSGCFIVLRSFAQPEKFNYKRTINGNDTEGWYKFKLPNEIFAHVNSDFSDIRIYGISHSDTTEVPYIIRTLEDVIAEEIIDLPILNQSKKNGLLYFTFELKDDQEVNYLDLNFEQTNYNAFVTLEGSHDQQTWFEVIKDKRILSIQQEFVYYHNATIFFPKINYKFLRIRIQSDVPLEIIKASFRNQIIQAGTYLNIPLTWSVHVDKKNKRTLVDITLKDYVPISQVSVKTKTDQDYYRRMTIEYVYDSAKTQKGWKKLYYPLNTINYLTSINPNNFIFNRQFTKDIRLIIANQDNAPLKITEIDVRGPQVELVTKLKPREFYLFYGNETIPSPSYDLIHFKENIPDSLTLLTLEVEESMQLKTSANPLFVNKIYLWLIIGLIIIVLAIFTLRMMKGK